LSKEVQNNIKIDKEREGSLAQLRAQLSNMNAEYAKMSEVERQATPAGSALAQSIAETTAKLKEEEAILGDHRRNVGNYEEATVSLRQELKNYVAQLAEMKLAGQDGTAEYIAMAQKAGELKDAMGDASQEIQNFGKDTRILSGLNEGVQTVVAGFGLFQSALGLTNEDSQQLNDTIKAMQITMGALQSLTAIQNALQKESAMMTLANAAAAKAGAIAHAILGTSVTATSVAFRVLKTAIISTGIGALVVLVGELIAHWQDLVGWFKKGTDGMSGFGQAVDKIKEIAMGVYA